MEKQEDIFGIRVDENGKETVRHIYHLMKWIFWLGLAIEILILVIGLKNYFLNRNLRSDIDPGYHLYLRIYTIYLIIMCVLMILQFFYFLNFTRQAYNSIKNNDSPGFNESFSWMRKSLWIFLVSIIVNGFFFIYVLFSGLV
ncbi:MAG TPA: hypothetical protein VK483_15990 [Chitinophagaceae bacterium]|nr:hypothetical protein [Chitinophagaceae bacterium]